MKIGKDKRKKNQTGGVVKLVAPGEASGLWGDEFDWANVECGLPCYNMKWR